MEDVVVDADDVVDVVVAVAVAAAVVVGAATRQETMASANGQ